MKGFTNIPKKLRIALPAGSALLLPLLTFAQNQTLQNPVQGAGIVSVQGFIAAFLKAVVQISLPILTLFIVYSGFMFVMARGNEQKLSDAKKNFFYVILGAILILGAWVLSTLIAATASQVLGGS